MSPEELQQFSQSELKFGYWFTKHRVMIKAVFLSVSFLILGILILFNINSIVNYYSSNEIMKIQNELRGKNIWETADRSRYQPQDLSWQPVQVVARSESVADLIVEVTNTNPRWSARNLYYHFILPGWESDVFSTYLLPMQTRRLVLTNIDLKELGLDLVKNMSAQVATDRIVWKRVRDRQYFTDDKFISLELEVEGGSIGQVTANATELTFTVKNNSDYNYAEVDVTTFLYNGPNMISSDFIKIDKVLSGQSYPVSLRWFGDLPPVTFWEVDLSTDILSEDNLLKFEINQF